MSNIDANHNAAADKAEHPGNAPDHQITITVDDVDHQVRPGKWKVSDLKGALGIAAARVLAEITPQGLKDLEDSAEIGVHEGERFMTHARSGGSS